MTRSPLSEPAERELANFRSHQALAISNFQKAEVHLEKFLSMLSSDGPVAPSSSVRCVRVWTQWLKENGPAYKSTIHEATGTKFSEHGTPHTIKWDEGVTSDTLNVPDDMIVRFTGIRTGRGGAPVIFALWSQRYEVYPKFGVGPVLKPQSNEGTLLGVIHPPEFAGLPEEFPDPDGPTIWDEMPEQTTDRFANLAEWESAHRDIFDAVVKYGKRPDTEQLVLLRSTCPEGVDANAAIALAAQDRLAELS
jgi:hypothetical protein